jgi:hypothetical protein
MQYIVTRTLEQALEAGPKPAMRAAKPSPSAPVAGPQAVTPKPTTLEPTIIKPTAPGPIAVASPPAQVLAVASPSAQVPVVATPPVPAAASPLLPRSETQAVPAPASPRQAEASRRSRRGPAPVLADDPPRDLQAEADYCAAVYPDRAREIRRYGGLPPNCSFGSPSDDLVRALLTRNNPVLCALDTAHAAAA